MYSVYAVSGYDDLTNQVSNALQGDEEVRTSEYYDLLATSFHTLLKIVSTAKLAT